MATSGTSSFNATCSEICRQAAMKVRAIRAGQKELNAQDAIDWRFSLNAMVKGWQAEGLHVWTVTEATLFPQASQIRYAVGTGASDHITQSYVQTALSADEAAAQTVLSVESTTDMTNADNIGVTLDDGSIHWTTINGVPGATVTITAALPDSASEGNAVFAYTSKIVRPLRIVDARRYNISSGNETPIEIVSRLDYQGLPNKTQPGLINQLTYDRQLGTAFIKLWMAPVAIDELVNFTWWRPIEDFNAAGNNPDLPQEWVNALIWNLALEKAPEYPELPPQIFSIINQKATQTKDTMAGFDREEESISFGVDMGR